MCYKIGRIIDLILSIVMILLIIALIIVIILMNEKKPKKYSDGKPRDINITGLESFDFVQDKEIPEYPHDNLGLTGNLILECFTGTCIKKIYHKEIKEYCYNDDCEYKDESWYEYKPIIDYDCSEQCYELGKEECNCSSDYYNEKGTCQKKVDDNYDKGKVCHAYNTIYYWRGKKYKIIKTTKYTYLINAKLKEEECPKSYKSCGIIDSYENKLCIPTNHRCPINYISESKSNEVYNSIIFNNKTLYYGNDPTTTNKKIIVGLVADSDLYLNKDNNKKDIVDIYTISGFLEDNKNLYRDVKLGYDPYQVEDIDKKGNSYLRVYYNEGFNLNNLRKSYDKYKLNHKINTEALNSIIYRTKVITILGLIACGLLFLVFIVILSSQCLAFRKSSSGCDGKACYFFFFVIFLVLIIAPLIFGCLNLVKLNKAEELDSNANYNTFRKLNIAFIILGFVLFLFLILYFLFVPININEQNISQNKKDDTQAYIYNSKSTVTK